MGITAADMREHSSNMNMIFIKKTVFDHSQITDTKHTLVGNGIVYDSDVGGTWHGVLLKMDRFGLVSPTKGLEGF